MKNFSSILFLIIFIAFTGCNEKELTPLEKKEIELKSSQQELSRIKSLLMQREAELEQTKSAISVFRDVHNELKSSQQELNRTKVSLQEKTNQLNNAINLIIKLEEKLKKYEINVQLDDYKGGRLYNEVFN